MDDLKPFAKNDQYLEGLLNSAMTSAWNSD